MLKLFDGHNDVLGRLASSGLREPVAAFLHGGKPGHIDLPRARAGGLAGGLFAIFSPSPEGMGFDQYTTPDGFDVPLPPPLGIENARQSAFDQIALLMRIIRASEGAVRLCTNRAQIDAALAAEALAVVLHLEGAEAIDPDLQTLELLFAAGLRSLGPVWSRNNAFGHGVPFRVPGSPDCGPGLTDAGKSLVEDCNELGIMVDLSHLTEQGFWDVARLSTAPLVATHSNAHALCPSTRNLTDRQLDAIRDSDGLVGVNFATGFLRDDGRMLPDTPLELIRRQLDYLIERLGEDRVGFGSDFDGAVVPRAIGDVAGRPKLIAYLSRHGYSAALLDKIGSQNWLSLLARSIG